MTADWVIDETPQEVPLAVINTLRRMESREMAVAGLKTVLKPGKLSLPALLPRVADKGSGLVTVNPWAGATAEAMTAPAAINSKRQRGYISAKTGLHKSSRMRAKSPTKILLGYSQIAKILSSQLDVLSIGSCSAPPEACCGNLA